MSRTFVFGDIHGCYDAFIALKKQIGITEDDLIISLGDIVDRGNKSLELYHYFKEAPNAVVLMGNHERKHLRGVLSYSQEIVKVQFGEEYQDFVDWVASLPYFYETDEAIIVHAFFEHDVDVYHQKEEVLSGTTAGSRYLEKKYGEGRYWSEFYKGSKPIIYGHHVVGDQPKIFNNTYGIDTAACHAGKLTALELPGFKVHQIQVEQDYWKEEQSKWQIPVLEAKNWEDMTFDQIQKQLDKLAYKKEPEVIDFFERLQQWVETMQLLIPNILEKVIELTQTLQDEYPDNFHQEVAKRSYKALVFKAYKNSLSLETLKKSLNTPQKVVDLAKALDVVAIPERSESFQ